MEFKIYIINLKQDTQKYKIISEKLDALNFEYKRFEAINGKNIKNIYDNYIFINKIFLPRSVIGCGLSHFLACKQHFTLHPSIPALILEDDAELLFKKSEDINKILRMAPNDWEIILLYSQGHTNYLDYTWDTNCGTGSTIGYLINYKGFKKRYNNYKLYFHTDIERYFIKPKIKIYKTPNLLIKPLDCESSTSSNYKLNNLMFVYLNKIFSYYLETEITGFKFDMFLRYKILRIPHFGTEFDFLQINLITFLIFIILIYKIRFN